MADLIPTQIQQQQVGFAPEVAPYAQDLLGRAQALTDFSKFPYQQYMGERFAQFTPLQQQAFAGAQAMEAAPQLTDASAMAGTAGLRALAYDQYAPSQFANFYKPVDTYRPTGFTAYGVGTQSLTGEGTLGQYMSPYMQNVVDIEKREAQRMADIAGTRRGQQFARAGAFGGARQAIENAEAQRNLATQMGDIQSRGLQGAFQQAAQQFNTEQQARMQAQLANQQARMQAQQAAEQSRQFGYGQLMQQAGLGAQYNQAAAQLGEQSRQYGAGLGLQGLQTGLQAAQQLGGLGQTQFGQNLAINQLQQQYGQQQQQRAQDVYNAQYQDFLNFQNYPYKQLGFMSDIIRGVPLMQTGATVYQQPPSTLGTLAGLGLGAYGLMKKEGGTVSSYADGGAVGMAYGGDVTSDNYVEGAIKRLSNAQLQQALKNALDRRDVKQAEMLQDELRERAEAASYSRGLASVAPQNMEEMLPSEESMRRGGIVSFAEPTEENNRSLVTDEEAIDEGGGGGSALRKDISSVFDYIKGKLRPSSGVEYEKTVAPIRSKTGPLSYMFGDEEEYRKAKVARDWAAANEERLRNDPELMAKFKADPYYTATTGTGSGRGSPAAYQKFDAKEAAAALAKVPSRGGPPVPAPAAPKGGKKADPATTVGTAMAQVTGSSPEDEIAKARRYLNFFKEEDAPLYKAMQEQIDDIKAKSKEIGESRTRNALSAFGFEMAKAASQVGAGKGVFGALRAAGAAAPAITESVRDTDKMVREYDRLGKQMQVAMLQSKVAAGRGDKQTALGLIKAAEQADIQRRTLDEQIRANRARERIAADRARAGNTGLERTLYQVKGAIARQSQQQALKAWNDPYTGAKLKKEYPSLAAYQKELYEQTLAPVLPQLQYLGTLGGQSDEG